MDTNKINKSNLDTTTPEGRTHILRVLWKDIRGAVGNVVRARNVASDMVDEITAGAMEKLWKGALAAYNPDKGISVRKYVIIVSERFARNVLDLHCNAKRHSSYTTTGNESSPIDGDVKVVGHVESTDSAADTAVRKHSKVDADSDTLALSGKVALSGHTGTGRNLEADSMVDRIDRKRAAERLEDAATELTPEESRFVAACEGAEDWGVVAERTGYSRSKVSREYRRIAAKLARIAKKAK